MTQVAFEEAMRQQLMSITAIAGKFDPFAESLGHLSNSLNGIQHRLDANTTRIEALEAARPSPNPTSPSWPSSTSASPKSI